MTALAKKKLSQVDESRLKISMGSKTIVVKDAVHHALTVVLAAKDFVSAALTSQPIAALAWTGVCVLLPVSFFF